MLTARTVCDLFRKYINEEFLLDLLFNSKDEDDNIILYYYSPKTRGKRIDYDPERKYYRLFKNDSFINKLKRCILNCEETIWDNIGNTISAITDQAMFDKFFDDIYALCEEHNLLFYLPHIKKNSEDYQEKKENCRQMAFVAFMTSAGKNLETSTVIKRFSTINLQSVETHSAKSVIIHPSKDPEYFAQYIYNTENEEDIVVFPEKIDNPDLKTLKKYSRILIKGPGGQGKSTFLYRLSKRAKSQGIFQNVIRIELAKLLSISKGELDRFCGPIRHIIAGIYKEDGSNNELINYLSDYKEASKKDLLLLDGLNELYASSDIEKISVIKDELAYISKHWTNTIILITTRDSEGEFSYKNCKFIDSYTICELSSVPKKLYDAFVEKHPELDDRIKELAKIPLYFNTLNKLESTSKINSKYDLLFEIYKDRYKQTNQDYDNFYAFFIIAPLIAREISNSNGNYISRARIEEIVNKYSTCNFSLLSQACQKECTVAVPATFLDSSKVVAILLSNSGPLKSESKEDNNYKFFHDEIRDFILSFGAYTTMQALKLGVGEEYRFVKDIYADFNFRDEPVSLFKSRLGISESQNLQTVLSVFYDYPEDVRITPSAILYAHTAFLISDYLGMGKAATTHIHNLLSNFTDNLVYLLKINAFDSILENLSENDKIRCKHAVADIFSKHCEYFRMTEQFKEGIDLVRICGKLGCDTDVLKNQKAKLLMLLYQQYIKTPDKVSVKPDYLGYNTYEEIFNEGLRLQIQTADNHFNLSANLIAMLNSVPSPFLIENGVSMVGFDFVKAFMTNYNVIFTNKQDNYVVREIEYTVRQAVALLIKGYVKVNPEIGYRVGYRLVEDQIVKGDRNSLKLSEDTLRLAEYLLSFAEGTHLACMNYCRGVISYHKKDYKVAKMHFEAEVKDPNLKKVFSHYAFGAGEDLYAIYTDIKAKMYEEKRNSIGICHPIYWYIDLKNLELSFDQTRAKFFKDFEQELPETWKGIVEKLTL